MNPRRAIPLAVAVAVLLVAVLGLRTWKRRHVVTPEVPRVAVPAPECPEKSMSPRPVLAERSQAPVIIDAPDVKVTFDGREVNGFVAAGTHLVEASSPDARSSRFQVRVEAMQPVLIDARVTEGVVTVLLLGARCSTCAVADADINLEYRTSAMGSLGDVARALTTGDWLRAAQSMRAVPMSDRESDEATRLIAVLHAFAGRQSDAEALLAKQDVMRQQVAKRAALLKALAPRQLETAVARWNATTERFQRLTEAFGIDAPAQITALTWAFDGFSTRFLQAYGAHDVIAGEASLQSASKALDETIEELRAMRPDDCEWQRRLVATF